MMQTLPFLTAKVSTPKGAIASEVSKQPNVKGDAFNQVLSKQMAQEEAKKASTKVNDKLAQERAKQSDSDSAEALVNGTSADEQANKNNVDAQSLALEVTAKTVQDVTDGKVVLDVEQTEAAKSISDAQFAITNTPSVIVPAVAATVMPTMQASNAKETKAEIATTDLVDRKSLGETNKKSTAKTIARDDVSQQKTSAATDNQQLENDQFVQTMIAESKMKSGQDATMTKAMVGGTETSTLATVSLQQVAAKLTTTSIQADRVQTGSNDNINVYPGKTGWNEAISQKVIWMVGATEQTAKLTLNPPELGPLEVIINVNNDKADATFISENPEVRKALEDGVSTLRQLMGQAGVELGQANVSTSKQQQEFQQSNQQQLARQQTANTSNPLENTGNSDRPINARETSGLVDIFA